MSRPVGPVGPVERRVDSRRGGGDRRRPDAPEAAPGRELVPVGEAVTEPHAAPATPEHPAAPGAAFAAQLIGQEGQKRGLRGGKPVLDAARSTYLGAEYAGPADRRPRPGKTTKTEI